MFFPIRDGITEALWELQALKKRMKSNYCYMEHFEYHLGDKMVQKIKEVRSPKKVVLDENTQTPSESALRSTPEPRKRLREPTFSPEVMTSKRPRTSKQPEEWVEVPLRKDLRKKKPKAAPQKPERKKGLALKRYL